jgi:hypothetical protein
LFQGFYSLLTSCRLYKGAVLLREFIKGSGDPAKILDKPLIEIAESQKRLNFFHSSRHLLIKNNRNLLRVCLNAVCGDNESKVFSPGNVEFALRDRCLQASRPQLSQHYYNMLLMLLQRFRIDQDIVHKCRYKSVQIIKELLVHKALKRRRFVAKVK